MCGDGSAGDVGPALPRPAPGVAVDPIALEPVDAVEVTTLVDNVFDALLVGDARTRRAGWFAAGAAAPQTSHGLSGQAADV